MSNPITTLTCPSCGGKLQISDKINRFACGYCGNEQIVHRESGIVYLEPIAEDVRHIRSSVEGMRGGVDKTAAELAIVRLTKELDSLQSELSIASKKKWTDWVPITVFESITILASLSLFFTLAFTKGNPVAGILWMISLVVFLLLSLRRWANAGNVKKEAIKEIQAEISDVKVSIGKNQRLIDS